MQKREFWVYINKIINQLKNFRAFRISDVIINNAFSSMKSATMKRIVLTKAMNYANLKKPFTHFMNQVGNFKSFKSVADERIIFSSRL